MKEKANRTNVKLVGYVRRTSVITISLLELDQLTRLFSVQLGTAL